MATPRPPGTGPSRPFHSPTLSGMRMRESAAPASRTRP